MANPDIGRSMVEENKASRPVRHRIWSRMRISIRILMLLTLLAAMFIRARVYPTSLTITINPNGQFEQNGKPLRASDIANVLQTYHTSQSWCFSRSMLTIVAPASGAPLQNLDDAMDYVSLSAHLLKFDEVVIDWYTPPSPLSTNAPTDSQLTELLQELRRQ